MDSPLLGKVLETVEREGRGVKMLRVGSDRYGLGQERLHRRDSACSDSFGDQARESRLG